MDLGRKTRVVNLNSFGAYFFFCLMKAARMLWGMTALCIPLHLYINQLSDYS